MFGKKNNYQTILKKFLIYYLQNLIDLPLCCQLFLKIQYIIVLKIWLKIISLPSIHRNYFM